MRAHELIATVEPDTELYRRVMAAIKFDLGDFDQVTSISDMSSSCSPEIPYPVCLLETHGSDQVQWYLGVKVLEGVWWRMFVKLSDGKIYFGDTMVLILPDSEAEVYLVPKDKGVPVERLDPSNAHPANIEMFNCICRIQRAVEVFSCCNVTTIEHQPPKFINAKRISKGKVPFFSYRTLHITGDTADKSEPSGGTHASPRLHLRRGHIRKLADGRRLWVRSTLVGDKSKGFVSKEYAV